MPDEFIAHQELFIIRKYTKHFRSIELIYNIHMTSRYPWNNSETRIFSCVVTLSYCVECLGEDFSITCDSLSFALRYTTWCGGRWQGWNCIRLSEPLHIDTRIFSTVVTNEPCTITSSTSHRSIAEQYTLFYYS